MLKIQKKCDFHKLSLCVLVVRIFLQNLSTGYIVTWVGSDKSQSLWVSHWQIHKKIHSGIQQVMFFWMNHWIIHSNDLFRNTDSFKNQISECIMSKSLIHSLTQPIRSKTLIHSGAKQVWATHLIIHSNYLFKNTLIHSGAKRVAQRQALVASSVFVWNYICWQSKNNISDNILSKM